MRALILLLSTAEPNLERAVIVVHGTNRDADRYYTGLVAAGELYLACNGWRYGDSALNAKVVYSFTVTDRLVQMLANRAKLPKLRAIVVVGHSAGGQSFSATPPGPGSTHKCATSEDATCTGPFQVEGAAEGCPSYNHYRYGIENLAGYFGQTIGGDIRKRFLKKDVVYPVGEKDVDHRERGTNFWSYMKSLHKAGHGFGIAPGCAHNGGGMLASEPGLRALFDSGAK